jgi:hypothetical protein
MDQRSDQPFHMSIEPRSEAYHPDADPWRTQVADMVLAFQREVGGLEWETRPVEGTKGGTDALVLALGSAGAFNAAVHFFRAWIERDRDRRVVITWTVCGQTNTVTITGEVIDDEAIAKATDAVTGWIGGSGCAPTTAPS